MRLFMITLAAIALIGGCSEGDPVPKAEAIDSVLEVMERERVPKDLEVELSYDVPKRFGDADRMWVISSRKAGFGGWVDADTGEVLDVLISSSVE